MMTNIRSRTHVTISLFLCYLLLTLLWTPFLAAGRSPLINRRSPQEPSLARYREGELLVRFRDGVSKKDKDTIIATHGARRTKQLSANSGLEKLEVGPGRDARATALQLMQNRRSSFSTAWFERTYPSGAERD